jgi:hypothetical protein
MSSLTFTDTDCLTLSAQSYGYTSGTCYTNIGTTSGIAMLPGELSLCCASVPSQPLPEPTEFSWLRNRIKEVLWHY